MATNHGLETKPPDEEPWWSQAVAAGEGQPASKPPQTGSTVSRIGGTVAQTSGQMGMPTEFGRYRVRKQLGGGGMGAVYLVENTELKREEALKVPHFGIGDDPEVRERFLREARAAAQVEHPNLCPVYDVGTINGVCFLTMRYLKGKLLSDFTGKPQPPRKAVEITAKLAQALESAHSKGVIHRDLKPNNVMMCAGVGPVVMDFGLAKQTKSEDQKLTQAGTTMGTPSYMPPEQVKGELDRIGPASDVYSLGVILFEMLTGRLPFKAATVAEVYGLVLHTPAPALASLRPGLDPGLDVICAKALAKTPEGRYPSMKAFAAVLIDFLKTAPAGEGAGNLTPTKAGPADIFQAATVAPKQAATPPPLAPGEPTQQGNEAPSRITKAASTHLANPQATVGGAKQKKGRWVAGRLGLLALILLILGAVGVGFLIYSVSQKEPDPSISERNPGPPPPPPKVPDPVVPPDPNPNPKNNDVIRKELKKFNGVWHVVSAERDGENSPPEKTKKARLTVIEDKYNFENGDRVEQGIHILDPTKVPKTIDLVPGDGEEKAKKLGIYELTDDAYKVCFAEAGRDRPTEFNSEAGSGNQIFVMKRGSIEPPPPPPPPPPITIITKGTVISAEKDKLVVSGFKGKDETYDVPMRAEIFIDDKEGKLADLKRDSAVVITSKGVVVVKIEAKTPLVERAKNELLHEDFTELEVGSRPKDWGCPDFGVAMEGTRPCLEVNKDSSKMFHATLPTREIKGDFEMDCEFRLGGTNTPTIFGVTQTPTRDQAFLLELTGTGSKPLRIEVNSLGYVQINAGQKKQADGYKPTTSLRLTRKGDVYNVSINDNEAIVGQKVPNPGVIQMVRIGLTGSKPFNGSFPACLYSVNITSTESTEHKPGGHEKTPAPAALREDFSRAAVGSLPEGWTASKVANLAVRKLGDSPALELMNPVLGSDQTTLPTVDLKGDFYADVTAVLTDRDTAVELFFKGPKTKPLSVKLDYRGGVTVSGQTKADGSKSWIESKPNVLRIERSGADKSYVIKLNGTAVGSAVPLTTALGPFTQVDLAVIKDVKRESPRITSVEVVPLEEAP
jgi:uncharacterized protein (TIGR03067 family)